MSEIEASLQGMEYAQVITNLVDSLRRFDNDSVQLGLETLIQRGVELDDVKLIKLLVMLRVKPEEFDQNIITESCGWQWNYPELIIGERASLLMLQGEHTQAVKLLEGIPEGERLAIDHARLGNARLYTGDFIGAESAYRYAVALDTDRPDYWNNLGGSLVRVQKLEDALSCYDQALALQPDHPLATQSRLAVARELGRGAELLEELEQKQAEDPDNLELRLALFHAKVRLRDVESAVLLMSERLEKADTLEPIDKEALADNKHYQGQIAIRQVLYQHFMIEHQYMKALAVSNQLMRLLKDPPLTLLIQRFDVLVELKQVQAAEEALTALEAHENSTTELLRFKMAQLYFETGREPQARDLLAEAFEQPLLEQQAKSLRAQVELALGNADAAQEELLSMAENNIMSVVQLINAKTYVPEDEVLVKLCAMANNVLTPEGQRNALGFALHQVFDKKKDYDTAFKYLKAANDIDFKNIGFKSEGFTKQIDKLIEAFTSELISAAPRLPKSRPTPVFVVGMPRSGTTLTESILGSHELIAAAGELPSITKIVRAMYKRLKDQGMIEPYPSGLKDLNKDQFIMMAKSYLRQIPENCRDERKLFVVDKMPHNFRDVGFIHLLFPHSPIIHVRRDPRDTALSNYQQNFGAKYGALGYASDLENMAQQFNDYHRIMQHWREIGVPMFEFLYEDLVADQEGVSRQLLEYVGVDWDENVKDFHKLERAVRTASVAQVRQTIYTTSKQKWRRYESHLAPFIQNLSPELTHPWDATAESAPT